MVDRLDVPKESGALFYSPPDAMDQAVDPLIQLICDEINRSGVAWTAESCQGHPDAVECGVWASNTSPMLRLVTREADLGAALSCLIRAHVLTEERVLKGNLRQWATYEAFEVGGFSIHPSSRPKKGWSEILVYLDARTAFQRNQALEVLRTFAGLLNGREPGR